MSLNVDNAFVSASSELQCDVADVVSEAVQRSFLSFPPSSGPLLARAAHILYLRGVLESVGGTPTGYDATRVWLTYWSLAGLDALGALEGDGLLEVRRACVSFLAQCQVAGGGFGGGPQQEAHAASTFAALASLALLTRDGGLAIINVPALSDFYARLRVVKEEGGEMAVTSSSSDSLRNLSPPFGAFRVTRDGEADVRGAYCVAAGAALAGIPLLSPLFQGTATAIAGALSHEGGAAGEAGGEAHGGYTYCALAALELLGGGWAADGVDINNPTRSTVQDAGVDTRATLRWITRRQLVSEGGFAGRANKVVDACYTFWIGASAVIAGGGGRGMPAPGARAAWVATETARYVLRAAQVGSGGFRDKPGKPPDAYHTCYSLAGLALGQWAGGADPEDERDRLHDIHPLFGIRPVRLMEAAQFWKERKRESN